MSHEIKQCFSPSGWAVISPAGDEEAFYSGLVRGKGRARKHIEYLRRTYYEGTPENPAPEKAARRRPSGA